MYLSVANLKDRLAARRVPIPHDANRAQLIELCRQHRLIKDCQVSTKAKRREWIIAGLREVGCELREDSRLCEMYIEEGRGDLGYICDIMAGMKFYYAHTDYAAILEDIHDINALPPKILSYRDAYDASEQAKEQALDGWIRALDDPMTASDHPELPRSLRHVVYGRIKHLVFSNWTNKKFERPKDRKKIHRIAYSWLSKTPVEDCVDSSFEEVFGDRMKKRKT
jgi:hypothetical protein